MQDWPILKELWQSQCHPKDSSSSANSTWLRQRQALYANHITHPLALQFLLQERPSLAAFQAWIADTSAQYQLLEATADQDENAHQLSTQQLAFWQEHGYLVLPKVIDTAACVASRDAIWGFLGASPDRVSSWYDHAYCDKGLMLPLYNHPRLNTNRASKRIRAAYAQLYGNDAIYKTIDHVSFNPPETASFSFRGNGLHWDVSLAHAIPERFQGLLYLSDCNENDGAFHCVPGFHQEIAHWLTKLPPNTDARQFAAQTLQARAITGKAGDFIIWHQALPHCATPNRGQAPRMVQYLSYLPEHGIEHSVWI